MVISVLKRLQNQLSYWNCQCVTHDQTQVGNLILTICTCQLLFQTGVPKVSDLHASTCSLVSRVTPYSREESTNSMFYYFLIYFPWKCGPVAPRSVTYFSVETLNVIRLFLLTFQLPYLFYSLHPRDPLRSTCPRIKPKPTLVGLSYFSILLDLP